ncbi:hypothetical protein CONPUDRAFT_82125 [Coniophora puteana RWD-64-598 SS2]|uniref:G-patch domain-containing protein n=1 Tax=Coniophora puteana (strain RWD-64-598) TaxID=741705 RepID=A0A5M3MPP6_CONPW|nr:uncharacterized protein CONPUDRAFT_82125 [Coniophora puteana RWD-64-598 SS2]EIW81040.1 hypothetical protein CONPUDRAFT_82125 [Coniophora puteana RWD-64-598 SS2]
MATTAHWIRSDYDPKDRERLERETGQLPVKGADVDEADPWETETTIFARRRQAPPSFVPAIVPYEALSLGSELPNFPAKKRLLSENNSAGWYRSIIAESSQDPPYINTSYPSPLFQRPSSAPKEPLVSKSEKTTKNNWFIKRALRSAPSTVPSTPPPTLADILDKEPPPNSFDKRFVPPVWLAIGPSNKGFTMLERSGWNEGEGLGAHVHNAAGSITSGKGESKALPTSLSTDGQEIIDLTLTDSDSEESVVDVDSLPDASTPVLVGASARSERQPIHDQRALLTPLPTVLKSDRLGIGLKAKTEGPYKQSKKRVTHGQAAMAAHIKASRELQLQKAQIGRGKRGFAKQRKREEDERRQLLADFNS